jgi:hypothetical protein
VSPAFAGCQVPVNPRQRRARQRQQARRPIKPTKHSETIFPPLRSPPETNIGYQWASVKQRGSIMWASILNLIYREILRTSLSGMHKLAID